MAAERFVEVTLHRSGADVPWGFRLTENSRFPTVVRVNPNGVAANIVQVGDLFLKIGKNFTEGRSYTEVLQLIKNEGNELNIVIDRGGTSSSLWSSTGSAAASATSPVEANRQFFGQAQLRSNDPDPKPFSYTSSAPNQLAEELRSRHDAMRKDRHQNLMDTAAARTRMGADSPSHRQLGSKAAMAALPRFTMSDPKDFTQSDVYRMLDMEARSPDESTRYVDDRGLVTSPQPHQQPQQPFYSPQTSYSDFTRADPTVRFDENVTSYGMQNDDDDIDYEIGNYQQKSIRYLGRNIPSKSFRMLQSLMGTDDRNGQPMAPPPEPAKPSMRAVKNRAAQRKAGGSAADRSQPHPVVTPTSPTATTYSTYQMRSDDTSFTDF